MAGAAHVLRTRTRERERERARFTVVIFSSFRVPSCQHNKREKQSDDQPTNQFLGPKKAIMMTVEVPRNAAAAGESVIIAHSRARRPDVCPRERLGRKNRGAL